MNLYRISTISLLLSSFLFAGCDIPDRPALTQRTQMPKHSEGAESSMAGSAIAKSPHSERPSAGFSIPPVFEPPAAPLAEGWETWDAYYSDDKHIGFRHVLAERLGAEPDADVRYTIDDHLLLRNGQSTVTQRLHHESIEDAAGQLKGFTAIQSAGPVATRYTGTVENGELITSVQRGVIQSTETMIWEPSYRGLVAVEQSLRQTPMKQGEVRMLRTLVPVQHRIASVRLYGGQQASITLLDGSTKDLLETNCRIDLGGYANSKMLLWTDESGTTLKSYTEAMGLLAFQTDQSTATAGIQSNPSCETGVAVRIKGTIKRPSEAKRTALVVRQCVPKKQPIPQAQDVTAWELTPTAGQAIRATADGSLQVLIDSVPTALPSGFVGASMQVTDADTQPSPLVDFNSELIRRIHTAASIAKQSELDVALEMTRTVKGVLEKSPQNLGLTRASEVAMTGVADATGHAVLLTALLRASKIPARVVIGLVYDDNSADSMKYHAWTVAYVDEGWLPLDATLGRAAPANRLALLTNDFSKDDVEQTIRELVGQIGGLQIKIMQSKY